MKDFIHLFVDQFDDAPDSVDVDTVFKDLDDWDSLVALSVISMIDESYGVTVTGDDIRNASTIQDLIDLVQTRQV